MLTNTSGYEPGGATRFAQQKFHVKGSASRMGSGLSRALSCGGGTAEAVIPTADLSFHNDELLRTAMGTVSGPEEEATKASKPVVGSAASSTMDLHATLPFASCPSAPGPGMPTGWGETEAGVLSSPPVGSALLDLAKSHPAMISVVTPRSSPPGPSHRLPIASCSTRVSSILRVRRRLTCFRASRRC